MLQDDVAQVDNCSDRTTPSLLVDPLSPEAIGKYASVVRDQQLMLIDELTLESGHVLRHVPVAYKTWGHLNSETADNCMVICHALTGSADVSDWWGPLLGRGRAFDPSVFFIVCANVLGSPYGTASPCTLNPETQRPYGADFPEVTIRDTVRLHRMVIERLGVKRVQVVIGGSMGGMQVLEWGFVGGPDFVRLLVPIATSGRHSAWCISWGEAQRQAIYSDPHFHHGNYRPDKIPRMGLAAARMQALLTYRSRNSFEARFGRRTMPSTTSDASTTPTSPSPLFSAQSYMRYQGDKFVRRFDANCYITLTRKLDSHDVSRDRAVAYPDILHQLQQPSLIIGVESDGLFTIEEQEELHQAMPNSQLKVITSPEGHDGFLIEFDQMNQILKEWLLTHVEQPLRDQFAASVRRHEGALVTNEQSSSCFGEAESATELTQW